MEIVFQDISWIIQFIWAAVLWTLPFFVISIGLSVLIQALKLDGMIARAFNNRIGVAIIAATAVGAFSPFCSCTVVPVVAGLLGSGVPLAPVMSFWIASPLMDPEIFALSAGIIGWELATVRLVATLILSLGAGYGTWLVMQTQWFQEIEIMPTMKAAKTVEEAGCGCDVPAQVAVGSVALAAMPPTQIQAEVSCCGTSEPAISVAMVSESSCCGVPESTGFVEATSLSLNAVPVNTLTPLPMVDQAAESSCCSVPAVEAAPIASLADTPATDGDSCCSAPSELQSAAEAKTWLSQVGESFRTIEWNLFFSQMLTESWRLGRWLLLAFLLEALITLYVPQEAIAATLGGDYVWAVPLAALIGVPLYLSNLSALPVISGLLGQGMQAGAAIA
ncbi:MAG: permease, partial [Chloroflexota bacterium]